MTTSWNQTYDSHVHFFGTGLKATDWVISSKNLTPPKHLLNQPLIRGFGLKHSQVEDLAKFYLSKPNQAFCISLSDGHSSLISYACIKKYGIQNHHEAEQVNCQSYLFKEKSRDLALSHLPKRTNDELKLQAKHAYKIFKDQGVKKIRHLTGNLQQWSCLKELELKDFHIDFYFSEFMGQSFTTAIDSFQSAQVTQKGIKKSGIKIFYDGSFGAQTAFSKAHSTQPRQTSSELNKKLKTILTEVKTEAAVHCIGELATQNCIEIFSQIQKKHPSIPKLHIEHAPIFTEKALQTLSQEKLNICFHFQPSHWLKDIHWYSKNHTKLDPHQIYPFKFLNEHKYEYHFGSDSPVEESSVELTKKGLELIAQT